MRSGIRIDSMDPHMGTATGTSELRAIYEKLAHEYKLAMPHYFGEESTTLFEVQPADKAKALLHAVEATKDASLTLMVIHTGLQTPEMDALHDADSPLMRGPNGESLVSLNRSAELKALISPEFKAAVKERGLRLITYHDLSLKPGLKAMKAPLPSKP
jgi:hypothetical protein